MVVGLRSLSSQILRALQLELVCQVVPLIAQEFRLLRHVLRADVEVGQFLPEARCYHVATWNLEQAELWRVNELRHWVVGFDISSSDRRGHRSEVAREAEEAERTTIAQLRHQQSLVREPVELVCAHVLHTVFLVGCPPLLECLVARVLRETPYFDRIVVLVDHHVWTKRVSHLAIHRADGIVGLRLRVYECG